MEDEIKQIKNNQSNITFYFMLTIAIIGSTIILFLNIYHLTLVEILTPFLAPFIEILGVIVFFMCSLIVFVYFVVSKSVNRARNGIPFLLNLIIFILVSIVPFTSIVLDIDFRLNKKDREDVVRMVLDGSLKPNSSDNDLLIRLPEEYKKLSKGGGEIWAEGHGQSAQILFFTYRGVMGNMDGFIYTANDSTPDEMLFGGYFIKVKKLDKNWYFVRAA
ncbi:hypothetical protein [Paenibacillus sinopodophylli]|uniref:hypothetical protein n=1 Tax=Paenibacillus sinopodophylli TaxID=1837342 RepID=UPI00110D0EAE|nr:hypothetical protein [Paenibacillus sinopodophylli]